MVDSLSFLSETLRSRVAVVPSMSCVYRFWYTAVSSMACSWLSFWWFALSSVELSSVCIRRNIDGVTSSFSSRSVRLRWWLPAKVSQDWLVVWFSRGVLEMCEGFVMVVGLSLDEISTPVDWFSPTRSFEKLNPVPILSLEVVSVALVKVSVVSGGVVLIPVCSGEPRGRISSSPVVSSRSGRDCWRCVIVWRVYPLLLRWWHVVFFSSRVGGL